MTGCDPVGAERSGALEERVELDVGVAVETGVWRATFGILVDELIDDELAEWALQIQRVVRNAQSLGNAAGVADVLNGAALTTAGVVLGLRLGPEAHGDPDDLIALLDQECCRDGRIHAAAHADDDALSHVRIPD